jgi:transcription elongation GreA/GreB family factor/very-short-patch-repair endonuclease
MADQSPMSDDQKRLTQLIEYVRHLAQLSQPPIFSLSEYKNLILSETSLTNRVGIRLNLSDQDGQIWLKVERLKRIDPPAVPESIDEWLQVSRDPAKEPVVVEQVVKTVSKAEAQQLVELGHIRPDDVLEGVGDNAEECDVIFRRINLKEVEAEVKAYIRGPWKVWADAERPRRETISVYEKLFGLFQTIETSGADKALEIVWGIGLARWRVKGQCIDHPLIEQSVELDLDKRDGSILVRPRAVDPTVALKPYFALELPGADAVLSTSRKVFSQYSELDDFTPFAPESYETILRLAATQLDQSGIYVDRDTWLRREIAFTPPGDALHVFEAWVVYARRRSDDFYISDLEKLKTEVEQASELPPPALRLIREPSDDGGYEPELVRLGSGLDIGYSTNTGGSVGGGSLSSGTDRVDLQDSQDFFFPKPFNDQQVAIVRQLSRSEGAVVQGPPGTGKTHTIANIICHYLATGRRVLVTSKGEAALSVLRGHIPKAIRDLTISLLTNEREGLKQLEQAVGILANQAVEVDPKELEREILGVQRNILKLQARTAEIESELAQWAAKHLKPLVEPGSDRQLLPVELAQSYIEANDTYSWFDDRPDTDEVPALDEDLLEKARQARIRLGSDLIHISTELPGPTDLPDTARIAALHEELLGATQLEQEVAEGSLPPMSISAVDALSRCRALLTHVVQVRGLHDLIERGTLLATALKAILKAPTESSTRVLRNFTDFAARIVSERGIFVELALIVPEDALDDPALRDAVKRAAAGRKPFGVLPFGKSNSKKLFAGIGLAGSPPKSPSEWAAVNDYINWRDAIKEFRVRWAAAKADYELPDLPEDLDELIRSLRSWGGQLQLAISVADENGPAITHELPELFPYGLTNLRPAEVAVDAERLDIVIRSNLAKHGGSYARDQANHLEKIFKSAKGALSDLATEFFGATLGSKNVTSMEVVRQWNSLSFELERIRSLQKDLATVRQAANVIAELGARNWASRIETEVATGFRDEVIRKDWKLAWQWRIAERQLREIDGRDRIRELTEELKRLDSQVRNSFADLVKLRTFLGLKTNISNRVAAALTMFATAIRNIGRGTGVRARRFRRDAQDAMERAYAAVPCWIMPTWRISESLPAALGSFDLIIVDEASQSDISALPALLRAKKVLIVGDDKQVSPTAAFVEERKILQLRHNYLQDQPFGSAVLPGASLYSLAQAMFPAERIMLREHFRCVEPIIRFSFQFYNEELVPLRLPKASERIDPPLVDVFVRHGHRSGRSKINKPEADAIVDEIEAICLDPRFAGRSIGVISLIGFEQAHYIQGRLLERIGQEKFTQHDISCGDSATFQGKERDIMFISMVACPKTAGAFTSLPFQQRFNVALSRARDRQYLFRSVTEDMLKPDDLKAAVIRHFKAPMPVSAEDGDEILDLCQSGFERDVLGRLIDRGYLARPQVRVGPYSIDIVVEGDNDQRLAIELDGDQYHTPERWADDFRRQRVLERLGWVFWRCWGSSYALDPDGCFEDLEQRLKDLGISPGGVCRVNSRYTEYREVGPADDDSESLGSKAFSETQGAAKAEDSSSEKFSVVEPISDSGTQGEIGFENLADEEPHYIEAGDQVLISYNDEPDRQYVITLSEKAHNPSEFVINVHMPMAQALLGATENDEVVIPAGGATRTVTVLRVDRSS